VGSGEWGEVTSHAVWDGGVMGAFEGVFGVFMRVLWGWVLGLNGGAYCKNL